MTNRIKIKIVNSLKYLKKKNLNIGSEGNISIRYKDGFLISPSAIDPEKLKVNDIPFVDLNGNHFGSRAPSSEWRMHMLLYLKKSDVKAISHSHSFWSSSLSCLRKKIPSFHYMIAEFGGDDIKCAKYATFGTSSLAKNVLKALENRKGCLMENHGQLTIGETIEEAISLTESLEKLSKQFFMCNLSKSVKLISKNEMSKVLSLFSEYKSTS